MKTMAVQLPAFCPLVCNGCRTIDINRQGNVPGNLPEILRHLDKLKSGDTLFVSSTGEPGFTEGYDGIITDLIDRGVELAVCCANAKSIPRAGFVRAEISRSIEQDKTSPKAIEKARSLGIPYVATVVNYGDYDTVSMDELVESLGNPVAVIVRQAQREGDAKRFLGSAHTEETKIHKKNDVYLGQVFPIPCFREFKSYRSNLDVTCINHMGKEVEWLGDSAADETTLVKLKVLDDSQHL